MKHITTIIATIIISCLHCFAQSDAVKEAAKSVFKLTTYNADGTVLSESNGVFTSQDGTAISSLKPFIGAAKAIITDTKGKQAEVTRMLGANELYDIAKFKVDREKTTPITFSTVPSKNGDAVWLITYDDKGTAQPIGATVKSVETFMDKYSYYIIMAQAPDKSEACPFVNDNGQIIGLMKRSNSSLDIHAVDANFAMSLATTGLSLNDPVLRQIGIAPALPNDKDQALLTLIMAEQGNDSTKLTAIVNDFLAKYPDLTDGYTAKARMQVNKNDFKGANETMEEAIKRASSKDMAHAEYGRLIYNNLVNNANQNIPEWTLDKAEEETDKAFAINPLPTYKHQKAQITFAKGKYQEAYYVFTELLNSQMRNPELFYEASQCKVMLKAPESEIIALLDSAINNTDSLRMNEAAPYFLARAEAYNALDSFRQAVFDYTRYEILVGHPLEAQFYYIRSKTETKAKLYKQALGDMAAAIIRAPQEPTYYAEMASLQLRVNLHDDAIKTAQRCIELAPEYSDGYLILGLAQISKGDKNTGMANLDKAKQLGNPQAQPLIDKYSNK